MVTNLSSVTINATINSTVCGKQTTDSSKRLLSAYTPDFLRADQICAQQYYMTLHVKAPRLSSS